MHVLRPKSSHLPRSLPYCESLVPDTIAYPTVLNLVYSAGFIIRDTQIIESQAYDKLSHIFLCKKKAVRLPVEVQATNTEALEHI